MSSKELEANLFTTAMRGDWKDVVQLYKGHPEIHQAKLTKSGDTALHIAISDGQDRIVEELVNLIKESDNKTVVLAALKTENERGNTPLHLAASLGNVRMCKCIADIDPELIGCRNHDNETPFFLAALHGRKDAFLCLHSSLQENQIPGYPFCRRNDGDTILHCAITGEYFDLAFQIINLYENLVDSVNEHGFSPLHLLANKPSAFRSGSHMTRFYKFIYHCIFVDKLKVQTHPQQPLFQKLEYSEGANYPENYQICANFARLIGKIFCLFVGSGKNDPGQQSDAENPDGEQLHRKEKGSIALSSGIGAQGQHLFPDNYLTCFEAIKLVPKAMLIIFGLGSRELVKIQERKEKHIWSEQVLDELLQRIWRDDYENHGRHPQPSLSFNDDEIMTSTFMDGSDVGFLLSEFKPPPVEDSEERDGQPDTIGEKNKKSCADGDQGGQKTEAGKRETPLLIAAKNGVVEMVEKLLRQFPMAIHDVNSDLKNIVLLAVEHRQTHVCELLLKKKTVKKVEESIFRKVDKDGNSALHLAASLREYRPWLIPGDALQMQWEIKWYKYVKNSMPLYFPDSLNLEGKTPDDIFTATHKKLLKSSVEWLKGTSETCTAVAALVAPVAFATVATVPGGVKPDKGTPVLENEPAFECFAISSLVSLCFSLTSIVMFLSILTSRYKEKNFRISLPVKLLAGLTSLFISIASMLISFCAGHLFVLKEKLRYVAFPVYAVMCLPVTLFAMAQFPLYCEVIWSIFQKVPQLGYKEVRF